MTTSGAVAELTDPNRQVYYAQFLSTHFTIQDAHPTPFDAPTIIRLNRDLDPGEITVMALAKAINGLAVIDETAARREAKLLDLRVTGTLGLLHHWRRGQRRERHPQMDH